MTDNQFNKLLLSVEKPARYTGGEYNLPDMNKDCKARLLLCFPDIYEIAMSNLGISILYQEINDSPDYVCERCFAPWPDFAKLLKDNNIALSSIETRRDLKSFDVVGFSVQYELLYSNILYMFDLAHIPFYAKDRGEDFPIMIAGGPCTVNPEPFAEFFDIIEIGEGEEMLPRIMKAVADGKAAGKNKEQILLSLKGKEGIYLPAYHKKGERVVKAVVNDFDNCYFPSKFLVPNIEIVHDRAVLELYRGCSAGCRFCQAGYYYRSIRERSKDRLIEGARQLIDNTGFDEMSLSSLSTGDYSELMPLITDLTKLAKEKNITLALPSLRLNSFEGAYALSTRMNSLTFAPEAGTQRLRDVINKNISEHDIFHALEQAFMEGYTKVKLYFMMGLPTETDDDILGIADLARRIRARYIELTHNKKINISVSCSVFIPKPATPFQWVEQIDREEMLRRQNLLRGELRLIKGVTFNWHGAEASVLESVFARGDKALSKVIVKAFELGAKFDGWSEYFKWDIWSQAFEECDVKMSDYTMAIPLERELYWDFIDNAVDKKYLEKEYKKAFDGITTRNCREGCNGCGANCNHICLGKGGTK